jgi:hypothetical protein
MTQRPDRDPLDHFTHVSNLLDEHRPAETMTWRHRVGLILFGLALAWLFWSERGRDNGPEWSGVSHVDGRG